jgi:hypothetical protein
MNERIRELAEQALKHPDNDNDGLTVFDNDELKKFAELIVRECFHLFVSDHDEEHDEILESIKEHFGVKE